MDDDWLIDGPTEPAEVRRRYDDWSAEYDAALAAWGYDAPARAARLMLDVLGAAGDATDRRSVLDAGCGTGLVGGALRAIGFRGELTGVDLSEPSLAIARERGAYGDLHTANLHERLPFGSDRFDAVVCVGVLSYVPDTEAIWRELVRVVRPGGVVVCTQRSDVWSERACDTTVAALERDGTWTVRVLTEPLDYMPGNPDFGHAIGVRYLAATVRR